LKAKGTNTNRGARDETPRCDCRRSYKEAVFVLGRPGNDLLSRVLRHSTIGAEEFNGRVRDGIGFFSSSLKSPDRRRTNRQGGLGPTPTFVRIKGLSLQSQSRTVIMRAIKPIERLVPVSSTRHRAYTPGLSTWSSSTALIGSTRFEVGFPLRCLQRLSRPYIAMLHCGWRHNSSTRGTSIPVLSY
jgi:hypothetical protein